MSRIDDLIRELCPDGVPHVPLGVLGEFIRGRRFTKADYVDDGLPSIHYGEIYTRFGVATTDTHSFVNPALAPNLRFARPGDVIFAAVGETIEDVGNAVAWLGAANVAVHDDCFIYRSALEPRYVAYFTQSEAFRAPKRSRVARAKVKRLSSDALAALTIPAPPLDVQREIVRILDNFAGLETQLEAELEAELRARRRQFDAARAALVRRDHTDSVALSDLGKWVGGITPSKSEPRYWIDGTIPWLTSMDVSQSQGREIRGFVTEAAIEETALAVHPAPAVAVVMRSNVLRRFLPIGLVRRPTAVNQDVRLLVPREGVSAAYVYHALQAARNELASSCVRTDGSMAAVEPKRFFAWQIPLPTYARQVELADRLDALEAVVDDLSIGLPAELNARRKQYEYYRDKLLTFPEVAA